MANLGEIYYNGKTVNLDKLSDEDMKQYLYNLESENNKLIKEQNAYLSKILN